MSRFTKPQLLTILRGGHIPIGKSGRTRNDLALDARVHDLITEEDYRDTAITSPLRDWNVPGPSRRSITADEILRGRRR